jgi:hypothetical protein
MVLRKVKDKYIITADAQEVNDLYGSTKSKASSLDAIISEVPPKNYESFMEERKRIMNLRDDLFEGIHHRDLIIR